MEWSENQYNELKNVLFTYEQIEKPIPYRNNMKRMKKYLELKNSQFALSIRYNMSSMESYFNAVEKVNQFKQSKEEAYKSIEKIHWLVYGKGRYRNYQTFRSALSRYYKTRNYIQVSINYRQRQNSV
jgi:hypothetical protein